MRARTLLPLRYIGVRLKASGNGGNSHAYDIARRVVPAPPEFDGLGIVGHVSPSATRIIPDNVLVPRLCGRLPFVAQSPPAFLLAGRLQCRARLCRPYPSLEW